MGMDIHLFIVKNKQYIAKDIFDGRNREWFYNMMGEGNNDVYNNLSISYGVSNETPNEWNENFKKEDGYFDSRFINVKAFKDWFNKYRPNVDAGWVSTYDKWAYETKNIEPEVYYRLPKDVNINDMHFIEIENKWDCSKWLYDYLIDNQIDDNAYIQYCFDW